MKPSGALVALEGIDGAGKSTLQRSLARRLRRRGWRVALWREPTRRSLGRAGQSLGPSDPIGAAIHFTLDRLLSRPRLERLLGRYDVVLSDRSFYSTLAYQGSAVGPAELERLTRLQRSVAREPDRVLWLDLPTEVALARLGRRGGARAPLERRTTLRRVARAYRRFARRKGWARLDATAPTERLARTAADALDRWLGRRGSGSLPGPPERPT